MTRQLFSISVFQLVSVCLCLSAPIGFNTQPIPGLVGWWTLNATNANGTVNDNGGLAYVATNVNGLTLEAGIVGQASRFTGIATNGNYLTTGANPRSNLFSISVWFKCGPQQNGTGSGLRPLVVWNGATAAIDSSCGISLWRPGVSPGGLVFTAFKDSGVFSVATTVTNNFWHHAVMVAGAGTTFECYLNGVTQGSGNNGIVPVGTLGVRIGGHESNDDRRYDGLIDDVRIYNRALSAEEVKMLYNGGYGSQR